MGKPTESNACVGEATLLDDTRSKYSSPREVCTIQDDMGLGETLSEAFSEWSTPYTCVKNSHLFDSKR